MNQIFEIKLQLAKLALQGKRIDEAEKIFLDIILDPNSGEFDKSKSWEAYGSIKSMKFRINSATLEEIAFSFDQARINGSEDAEDLYANEVLGILLEYSQLIKSLKSELEIIKATKFGKAVIASIGLAIGQNMSWKNSPFLKVQTLGFGLVTAADYYKDRLNENEIPNTIKEIKEKFHKVLKNYNQLFIFKKYDLEKFVIDNAQLENLNDDWESIDWEIATPQLIKSENRITEYLPKEIYLELEKLNSDIFEGYINFGEDQVLNNLDEYYNNWKHILETSDEEYILTNKILFSINSNINNKKKTDLVFTDEYVYRRRETSIFKKENYEEYRFSLKDEWNENYIYNYQTNIIKFHNNFQFELYHGDYTMPILNEFVNWITLNNRN
jgi:hypothetical protein